MAEKVDPLYLGIFLLSGFIIICNLEEKNLRSLVNIYADDNTVYGSTTKNPDDQSLAADLSYDLAHTDHWGRNWLIMFNNTKTKLVTFHHHRADPGFSLV